MAGPFSFGSPNIFGAGNPIGAWVDPRRNQLQGLAAGLLSGDTGDAFRYSMLGSQTDAAIAKDKAQQLEKASRQNGTTKWLTAKGYTDLVPLAEAGQSDIAVQEALKRMQPGYGAGPEPTANMRDFAFAQANPDYAAFISKADPTTAMQEYQFAVGQGYQGDFTKWKTDVAKAGASNINMNNEQANAATYADRMANAERILSDPKITAAMTDVVEQGKSGVPLVGNFLTSTERKLAEQAQRDFINAVLRKESGAVISPSEFANAAQQYFPQPGDTPEVIQQKAQNRAIAIQGISRSAGPTYQAPTLTPDGVVPFTDFFK